jgi:hypothetical protein
MKYRIEIRFHRAPSFSADVEAEARVEAEVLVLGLARQCGWREMPIKARVLPLSAAESYAAEQSATAVCLMAEPPEKDLS